MTVELSIIISCVSVAFAIFFGLSNARRDARRDTQEDTTQLTTVIIKLESITNICTEIKSDLSNVKADVKDITERLVVVEQSLKSAWKQINEIKTTRVGDKQ